MIPRFRVPFGAKELSALALPARHGVADFERSFAAKFGASDAIAFAYGRTAQWAFLQAVGVHDAEVVMPAYTCSVVAHAVTLSGNTPVFVDISLDDYNPTPNGLRTRSHREPVPSSRRTRSAIPRTPSASAPSSLAPRIDSATRSGWSKTVRTRSVRPRAATSWRRLATSRSSV